MPKDAQILYNIFASLLNNPHKAPSKAPFTTNPTPTGLPQPHHAKAHANCKDFNIFPIASSDIPCAFQGETTCPSKIKHTLNNRHRHGRQVRKPFGATSKGGPRPVARHKCQIQKAARSTSTGCPLADKRHG